MSAESHHPTTAVYYSVFVALLILLLATVAVAEFDLGESINFPVAVLIASAKAALIILFFMHVRYSPPLIWLVAGGAFFWLGIMFALTFNDYFTRIGTALYP